MSPERVETEVDGRRLSLSNLDKVLYPTTGFTKGEVINYYARVADVALAHIADRPITMKRYPNGVDALSFYEKHARSHIPEWVQTVQVPSRDSDPIDFVVISDRATLVWAANLAAIELHVPLWHIGRGRKIPANPDHMVFDLDPGPDTSVVECCRVTRFIADHLGQDRLFPKTSGSKGLQLYMPLKRVSSERANERAHEIAQTVKHEHPELVVSNMRRDLRNNKVLIDWSQNHPAKTTVAPYSLRAQSEPTISTPISWDEIDHSAIKANPDLLRFDAAAVMQRVGEKGDLMARLLV